MTNRNKAIILAFVFIFLVITISLTYTKFSADKYVFILNGTEMDDLMGCENAWHYENISVVPCAFNKTVEVLQPEILWWDYSPEQNCQRFNGTFVGFNIYNQSRAKEIYERIMPKCWTLVANDLPAGWLEKNCECVETCGKETCYVMNNQTAEGVECSKYKCGKDLYYGKV